MHLKKRFWMAAALLLGLLVVIIGGTRQMAPARDGQGTESTGLFSNNKDTIYFWYTDDNMTSFINSAAVAFGEERGVRVIPVLTSEGEYLEVLNSASLYGEQMPDVYLLGNDSLEKAYLAGLASETADEGKVMNTGVFPQAALNATSYHGKTIAYPLYFETTALVYNETYLEEWAQQQAVRELRTVVGADGEETVDDSIQVEEARRDELAQQYLAQGIPETVDDILSIADTFDVPEGVEGVMKWDVSDIFYNYWIAGYYMDVGGPAGDDEARLDIYNEETIQCLEVYKALNQFFSMESETISYESVIQDFIDGKIMFTVATTDVMKQLEDAKADGSFQFEYGLSTMPEISDELKSASLSVTGSVVVNGYSNHRELANEFAQYLVDDCAEDLYEKTGKIPAKTDTDVENGGIRIFKMEYADSVSMPKMMETGNLWLQMEVLFSKVWNGADVETLVSELDSQIASQIVTQ